jgi:hypothetical protein
MLGRLKMTVDECLDRFLQYADQIFSHKRLFWLLAPIRDLSTRYSEKHIKKAIGKAVGDFDPSPSGESWKKNLFAFQGDRCKT